MNELKKIKQGEKAECRRITLDTACKLAGLQRFYEETVHRLDRAFEDESAARVEENKLLKRKIKEAAQALKLPPSVKPDVPKHPGSHSHFVPFANCASAVMRADLPSAPYPHLTGHRECITPADFG
eukprot:gnl/Hemi2/20624_TR6843_c0_g5_i1.p2 gnl/Hemi2/20624_TR6843_c0_g5~~gnl/Hemi2/20624_TR6843_c0_g5_i1.p2  ORF type:complete len:126 (-),score=20.67 gnl/Hemi2/20624_TR6843_c0_g5_i1:53-430(-)